MSGAGGEEARRESLKCTRRTRENQFACLSL